MIGDILLTLWHIVLVVGGTLIIASAAIWVHRAGRRLVKGVVMRLRVRALLRRKDEGAETE